MSRPTRKRARPVKYAEEDYDTDERAEHSEEEEEEPAPTRQKTSNLGTWQQLFDNSLIVFTPKKFVQPQHTMVTVTSFDFDSTLVETKSGRAFATGANDWKLWHKNVKTKLHDLHEAGHLLVIFTNQNGIGKGKLSVKDFKGRMEGFLNEIGEEVPIIVLAATEENHFRKPSVGMWEYLRDTLLDGSTNGVTIDMYNSIYVGDAAGRPKGWETGKKKDHSCGDRKFALNVQIQFATPEKFFLGKSEYSKWKLDGYDVKKLQSATKTSYVAADLISSQQEVVIFVGFPASGKSTFFKRYFGPNGYVHVNRDTLGTPAKCLKACVEALENGKSVVIDNTNPSSSAREPYIEAAKDHSVPVRCFRFKTDEELAKHLNVFRENISGGKHKHVPRVGYNMFKKNLEEPKKSEGFSEIKEIDFIPIFSDETTKSKFFHYT